MVNKIKELLAGENITLSVFRPLQKCIITKRYLLDRAGISDGYAVIFAIPYYTHACDLNRNISAYATGRDYHYFVKELEERLIKKLKALYPETAFAIFADHSPIDERDAAARGGLGIYGKNNLLITEPYSSYVFLGELIVGARLEEGEYTDIEPRSCEDCGLCQKSCPMKKGECDECLSAITQKKGTLSKDEEELLVKYSLWGCDICQEVCPHTKKAKLSGSLYSPIEFFNSNETPFLTHSLISDMSDEEFSKRAYSWRGRETVLRNTLLTEKKQKGNERFAMIELVYGLPGTGKTSYLSKKIEDDIKNGKKVLLIVPEQQTVEAERAMLKLLPPSAQLSFEALNFSRLANKIFRQYGGLSYNYITEGMKALFMKRTLLELTPQLSEYALRAVGDSSLPALMLSQINEFKINGISAAKLEKAANSVEDGHPLKNKLTDLSTIYSYYEETVLSSYDDSSNDLEDLYSRILCKHDFFGGYNVYVDSFSSFTAGEHKIIEKIFDQADNTVITLPICGKNDPQIHQASINEASKKLTDSLDVQPAITVLSYPHRAKTEALKRIWGNLWDFSVVPSSLPEIEADDSLSVIECDDEYAEAEAVANTIKALVANGYRHKDIAVIAGNMDTYRGIIDSTLEKAEIPFFMSEKTGLVHDSLISMILSALAIMTRKWRAADVIAYLKTGLTDISAEDTDLFEIYVSTWNISGNRFLDGEWTMNPDGYSSRLSPRGKVILERANKVREALVEPLLDFFTRLNAAEQNISKLCEATYGFFKSMKLSQKMNARAERAYNLGDRKTALALANAHKAFIKVLSDIASAMGDKEMSIEEFASSLKLVFGNTDIGTIPTAADEVVLGSASMFRASNVKCAILVGLCEGQFPASTSDCGFFSDNEKAMLKELDLVLSNDTARQNAEELLYAYRAMTLPSDRLYLLYHTNASGGGAQKPSLAVTRTQALLPKFKTVSYSKTPELSRLTSKRLAFESIRKLDTEEARAALRAIFEDDPEYAHLLKSLDTPISDSECFVSEETARRVFGESLKLSQSKLEKYIKCHFAYYCRYALDLRENDTASFKASDSGTFIHYVLEIFVKATVKEDGFDPNMTREEITEIVTAEADKYVKELFGDQNTPSKRLEHLFDRLKRLALIIAIDLYNEISASSFVPTFFEMGIGKGNPPELPSYRLELKDGSSLTFEGIVDRVDIFKRDNEVFVKVVDYKTGPKSFKISDVKKGLNIQMLMYLFAICNSNNDSFNKAIGKAEGDLIKPAGVMYISTNVSAQKTSRAVEGEELIKLISEGFTREGLILNDEEIVLAANKNLDKNYLMGVTRPSPTKKDPDAIPPLKGKALTSKEDFDAIENDLTEVLTEIAAEMRSGNASVAPLMSEKPCEYCQMKQFCRTDVSFSEEDEEDNED